MSSSVVGHMEELPSAQILELSELDGRATDGKNVLGGSMDLLQGVKVSLKVVLGEANTTLGELMNMKEQSVLKIDREIGQPIDITVNGNVVARGELVAIDDNFGVRITEIAATARS